MILKEIVGQVFEIYAIELLGSLPTDEAWRHLRYTTFAYGVHWQTGSMYAKVYNDSLNITIVTGSQISQYLSMGHTFDPRNIEI